MVMRQILYREALREECQKVNLSTGYHGMDLVMRRQTTSKITPLAVAHTGTSNLVNGLGTIGERKEQMDWLAYHVPLSRQLMC